MYFSYMNEWSGSLCRTTWPPHPRVIRVARDPSHWNMSSGNGLPVESGRNPPSERHWENWKPQKGIFTCLWSNIETVV